MIRLAQPPDRPALMALWRESFAEKEDFLQAFFALRFPAATAWLAEVEGELVSAVFLFTVSVLMDGKPGKAEYLVGASTKASFRKQGHMTALLTEVENQSHSPILLFPANRAFYEKRRYKSGAEGIRIVLPPSGEKTGSPSSDRKAAMVCRQKMIMAGGNGVLRDDIGWQLAMVGRRLVTFGEDAYALIEGDRCVEAEATDRASAESILAVLSAIGVRTLQTSADSVFCRVCPKENQKKFPLGMVNGDPVFQNLPIWEEY